MITEPTPTATPSLEEYAAQLVDDAPPFTPEQQDLIRGLFAPVVADLNNPKDHKKTA